MDVPSQAYRLKHAVHRPIPLDFESELNDAQRAVVTSKGGPTLVIAGAGSGKTRTLIYRTAYLLNQGVSPSRLLLCTFTRRAARDMVAKLNGLVSAPLQQFWAGTFHHIANLALRQYGSAIGLAPNWSILDREDATDLLSRAVAESLGSGATDRRVPGVPVLSHIASMATNQLLDLEQTVAHYAPRFADRMPTIATILARFRQLKSDLRLLDYDDLLGNFRLLLSQEGEARDILTERFEHILVDEYQDTNTLQGNIVDLCATRHRNIMVVGDDAQSIYSFRGANIRNIIEFSQRYPDAAVYKLERNYRSVPEVLSLANRVIVRNRDQLPKTLSAAREQGAMPVLLPLADVYQQSAFVTQRILELHQEHNIPLREIAVLYRTHAQSLEAQVELTRCDVPFHVRSGLRFFEQAHIKDILAHLRVLQNNQDALAWQRVLKLWPGMGKRTIQAIVGRLNQFQSPLASSLLQDVCTNSVASSAKRSADSLIELFAQLESDVAPQALIRAIIDRRYRDFARNTFTNADTRLEDLLQLGDYAATYGDLGSFLNDIALVSGAGAETTLARDPDQESVTLSTIHQAKGLEWRVVFILWLADGRFPQPMALRSDEELAEERRLFYVAITRAKDHLYLCYPRFEDGNDGPRRILRVSRFLSELGPTDVPYHTWAVAEAEPEASTMTDSRLPSSHSTTCDAAVLAPEA